jgi:eukaryotic-like serine/threonine-protein kinase
VRRCKAAKALALDLENHLNHQPVTAVAPTLAYRLAKFAHRNRILLASVAGFTSLLITSTAVGVWQAVSAHRARDVAEKREGESRVNLWASYLATARASRMNGQLGRRFDSLEAVGKAAAIRPTPALRSKAATALGLADVRTAQCWSSRNVTDCGSPTHALQH